MMDPLKLDLGADELDIKAEVPVEAMVSYTQPNICQSALVRWLTMSPM